MVSLTVYAPSIYYKPRSVGYAKKSYFCNDLMAVFKVVGLRIDGKEKQKKQKKLGVINYPYSLSLIKNNIILKTYHKENETLEIVKKSVKIPKKKN